MDNFWNRGNGRVLGALLVAWLFAAVGAVMGVVMWEFDINQMGFTFFVLLALIFIVLMIGWSPLPEPPGRKKAPTVDDHRVAGTGPFATRPAARKSGGSAAAAPSSGTAQAAAVAPDPAPETPPEGRRPEALSSPRDGTADDLKQIKGIGPALEKLCHSLGFYHFDQIANWTAEEVAWVDANLEGFKGRVTRDDWVAQAKLLASGGTTAFAERVEKGEVY